MNERLSHGATSAVKNEARQERQACRGLTADAILVAVEMMSLTSGTLVFGAGLLREQMRVQACREGVHFAASADREA
jgi:hypothetical protein